MKNRIFKLLALAAIAAPAGATQMVDVAAGTEDIRFDGRIFNRFGDVDGDGIDDFLSFDGRDVFIVFGRPCFPKAIDLATRPFDVVIASKPGDNMCASTIGDVNGDGIDDLLFGYGLCGIPHDVAIVFGRKEWPSRIDFNTSLPDARIVNTTLDTQFAVDLAVGDLNGDGIGDAIVGGSGTAGEVRVFRGRPAWPPAMPKESADLLVEGNGVGVFVAAGDVNGDGIPDLVMGAPGYPRGGSGEYRGSVAVLYGSPLLAGVRDLALQPPDVLITGTGTNTLFPLGLGQGVSVGDLNGDGYADIASIERVNPFGRPSSGQIQLIAGGPSLPPVIDLLSGPHLATVLGRTFEDLPNNPFTIGDATGDGIADLVFYGNVSKGVLVFSGPTVSGTMDLETVSPDVHYFSSDPALWLCIGFGLGDVNGGGQNDFILATCAPPHSSTRVYLSDTAPPPSLPSGPACAPLGQGFWHRQCLSPGVGGPIAGHAPFHPRYPEAKLKEIFGLVEEWLFCNGFTDGVCDALVADPASDPCEKARRDFMALLLNIAAERLGQQCELKDSGPIATIDPAQRPRTVEDLLTFIPDLLQAGDAESCKLARDVTNGVNSSELLLAPAPLPFSVSLGMPGRASTVTPSSSPTHVHTPVTTQP